MSNSMNKTIFEYQEEQEQLEKELEKEQNRVVMLEARDLLSKQLIEQQEKRIKEFEGIVELYKGFIIGITYSSLTK